MSVEAHNHKLKTAWQGALAGGGDPATSPLYVFGPFLKIIVVAGVAQITFGASVWLAVVTIVAASAMYKLVMQWITDGSGGSGMSAEEFGQWAVKIDASITLIEYTLTFLVSIAALVTFVTDRYPLLNQTFLGIEYRTILAIVLSIFVGYLVNLGPRRTAKTFGIATGGVLALLWTMAIFTVWKTGFHIAPLDFRAFNSQYLSFTVGGFARILAVMTGIEVFANLVPAYEGTKSQQSDKAFKSLAIVMGTTVVTMLVVGPAILLFSDPANTQVSVFTQTMDALLPQPLPYLGTIVGVAVLMSASAASAIGLQNLAQGLTKRRYLPGLLGRQNGFGIASAPVWIEVAIVCLCFLIFGVNEELYLSLYAAGVFVLLSLAGWAVTKRLLRESKGIFSIGRVGRILSVSLAAFLTSSATVVVFVERFRAGAWLYFVLVPALFVAFTYSYTRLNNSNT